MSTFDAMLHAFSVLDLPIPEIREANTPCSCSDCYTDAAGKHRCRCDLCRPHSAIQQAQRDRDTLAEQQADEERCDK